MEYIKTIIALINAIKGEEESDGLDIGIEAAYGCFFISRYTNKEDGTIDIYLRYNAGTDESFIYIEIKESDELEKEVKEFVARTNE